MAEQKQILVKFVTKLPPQLRVPELPLAVPVNLKRYGLSQVINHLLSLETVTPFDFLVGGELLRKSLEQHLLDRSITTEAVLEIEYTPAVTPPKADHTIPQPEWVSSVCGCWDEQALAGSYDGVLRMWTVDGECSSTTTAHTGPVTAVAALPAKQGRMLLSAGQDSAIKLWQWPEEGESGSQRSVACYRGHTDTVQGIAVSPSGESFFSCGWDGQVLMWPTGHAIANGAEPAASSKPAAKKRRAGESAANGAAVTSAAEPAVLSRLEGHQGCVSAVCWPTQDTVVTAGWDHSVRCWNAMTGVNTDTYNSSRAVHCAAVAAQQPNVVAFGGAEASLRIWDTRGQDGEGLALRQCTSHTAWITALAWRPSFEHHIITGSQDSSLKLWDVRSAVPLATLQQHTDKVLCVAWLGSSRIASGGADSQLQLYTMDSV